MIKTEHYLCFCLNSFKLVHFIFCLPFCFNLVLLNLNFIKNSLDSVIWITRTLFWEAWSSYFFFLPERYTTSEVNRFTIVWRHFLEITKRIQFSNKESDHFYDNHRYYTDPRQNMQLSYFEPWEITEEWHFHSRQSVQILWSEPEVQIYT